jgi:hypothetical protein
MDVTRHWRLHTSRAQLFATCGPSTGQLHLPQHSLASLEGTELYLFDPITEGGNGHHPGEQPMGEGYTTERANISGERSLG